MRSPTRRGTNLNYQDRGLVRQWHVLKINLDWRLYRVLSVPDLRPELPDIRILQARETDEVVSVPFFSAEHEPAQSCIGERAEILSQGIRGDVPRILHLLVIKYRSFRTAHKCLDVGLGQRAHRLPEVSGSGHR